MFLCLFFVTKKKIIERDAVQNISQKAPEFIVAPRNVHVEEGANITLSCHVNGNPPPSVQWSRGRQILRHGTKYKISSIGEEHFLDISSANVEDIGPYTCTLCNPTGTISANCHISVGDVPTQPTQHSQRSHKIRIHRDHSSKYNGTESESSDVSSLDSEHFQAHLAVKAKTVPIHRTQLNFQTNGEQFNIEQSNFTKSEVFHGTQSALKRNSEPFHVEQSVNETVLERQVSAPVKRNPVEVNIVNTSSNEINSNSCRAKPLKRFENRETNIASKFVQSVNVKQSNGSQFSLPIPKSPEKRREPVIEKKGGVSQVDFRGVLKQSTKDSSIRDFNGQSRKHVNDTVEKKNPESNNHQQKLSRTRQLFEKDLSTSVPKSHHSVKTPESVSKGLKVNQALKKFEENTAGVQSDYRNILKPRKDHTEVHLADKTKIKEKPTEQAVSQLDFRNVLKKKTETKSVPESNEYRKVKSEFRTDHLSDSSFEKKSLQKQRAELVVNVRKKSIDKIVTTPKQKKEFEIPTPNQKKAFDLPVRPSQEIHAKKDIKGSHKSEVELPVVKPKTVKPEPQLVEFRSVLTRPERQNSKESVGDIIKPVARRLSQSKALAMDIKPEIKEKLENQSVDYGSEVVLQCQVTGSPKPELSWSINDKEIKQSKFFRMSYNDDQAKLVIAEAFSEDEGEYTCTAQNTAGVAKTSCNLTIEDRPGTPENTTDTIEEPFSPTATRPKIYNICPAEFCILRGGTIEFKASYTSVPPGTVTWSRGKQDLKQDARMKIETTDCFSTLTIVDIEPEDSGRFNIKVENKLGSDEAFASLSVEDVPDAPVGHPCVSDVSLYAATVSWYGPAYDGGCPITNYRVEMCDAEEQEWTLVTSKCLNTTYRVEKLQAHTPYFFRVFAENKHGLSKPCLTPDVTVTSDRRPSALLRLPSTESDDEVSFEHREVTVLAGRVFENFYNCLQEVGKGKFGSVYKCEEKSSGKIWAAKIIKCRENEKKKLHLEVEIMNKLKHPKILQLWDVFDAPRKMILVMEYIGGGELFERVIDDDFELTERDCIQFMRQICDAVHYMHGRNILHLDLKPENILCIKNESNKVKIIDFGLARYYNKGESVRVMFGTPEFIAPEVVNYDEIGFTTDMWSIGVICYVLLTGLSPFMGDSDAETLSNVTQGEFDFEEEEFDSVSNDGKNFIESLLVKQKKNRMTSLQALEHAWLANDAARLKNHRINTKNLKKFMARRKWQKTGNAIRALGRMRNSLQKLMKTGTSTGSPGADSLSSASGVGSSSSNSSISSMGSQNAISDVINASTPLKVIPDEDIVTTNQNGGKTAESSSNFNQKHTSSWNTTEIKEKNSDVNGHGVDINLNLTNEKSKSAFVSCNSNNSEKSVENTLNPVNVCNDCQTTASSNQNAVEDSRTKHLPVFKKEMVDSKAFPGDVVRFDVEFIADKNTNVSWYFEDELLIEDENHCVQQSGNGVCSLIIKNVCEDDDGEYMCKIMNSSGEETCSAELIVYGAL